MSRHAQLARLSGTQASLLLLITPVLVLLRRHVKNVMLQGGTYSMHVHPEVSRFSGIQAASVFHYLDNEEA